MVPGARGACGEVHECRGGKIHRLVCGHGKVGEEHWGIGSSVMCWECAVLWAATYRRVKCRRVFAFAKVGCRANMEGSRANAL